MKMDFTPTIDSLVKQRSLYFTGDKTLIYRTIEYVFKHFYYEPLNETDKQHELKPIYEEQSESLSGIYRTILQSAMSQHRSSYLYRIELGNDFKVIARIKSNNGYFEKVIHHKTSVNPKRLTHSIKALCRALAHSSAFFICQKCHQLIDANFMENNVPQCAFNSCKNMVRQPFHTGLVDHYQGLAGGNIRVQTTLEQIQIFTKEVQWPHPHKCDEFWVLQKSLPAYLSITAVQEEVLELSEKLEGTCTKCNKTLHRGHMRDDAYCHGCASTFLQVVY